MAKIDFDQILVDLEGAPLNIVTSACPLCGRPAETKPAILSGMCADALVRPYLDARDRPQELSGDEAAERYELALTLVKGGTIELKPEQVTLLRKLLLKRYPSPLYSAQAREMLDPKDPE